MINRILATADLALSRRSRLRRATHSGLLQHVKDAGFSPGTVIDVGAASGEWTREAAAVFPEARFLMIEPLSEFQPALAALTRELADAAVIEAAAGSTAGERILNVHVDLVGSSMLHEVEGASTDGTPRRVPVVTIDDIVSTRSVPLPFAVKVDVQGDELAVLVGAERTLSQTGLVVLETSLLPFYRDGPVFSDVVAWLADHGFAVYDVVGLLYRPLDDALAQVDLVFVPDDSPLRRDARFATPEQRQAQNRRLRRGHQSNGPPRLDESFTS